MIGDVGMAARWLEYQAGVAFEIKGDTLPSMSRSWLQTRREPYGVVGRIIAYNHPILFAAGKIGAPVVMGNTLVLKAPDQGPLSTLLMAEIVQEVFPPGVVNLITGTGAVTGDALVRHPEVKRVALIGSVLPGSGSRPPRPRPAVKHVSLELGGKNPMIVCADADLDAVVEGAAFGMNCHWCQGQSCGSTTGCSCTSTSTTRCRAASSSGCAPSRSGTPGPGDRDGLPGVAGAVRQGDLLHPGRSRGRGAARHGRRAAVRATRWGRVLRRADRVRRRRHGMRIAREEIFGPVLSVLRWSDLDQVVDAGQRAALRAHRCGVDPGPRTALTVADRLDTGYVWINGSGSHFLGAPFSGHKNSGTDSEEGIEELQSYTQPRPSTSRC